MLLPVAQGCWGLLVHVYILSNTKMHEFLTQIKAIFSFVQVSFIYSIQNKELIDGKIFGSQSKALDKIWIDKKGGVATFYFKQEIGPHF